MTEKKDGYLNIGFSVWLSICVFVCLWLWSSFTKGRRRFQTNLHVIEDGLRKMQADIELRQREKSIGCVEDVEDISEFLKKFYEEGKKPDKSEADPVIGEEAVECEEKSEEKSGEVEDKKTV
ncbi:uncharacterized protein LOC126883288 isoform X1 [Diabrotica virgifera virgifera]|uniref:Uncharacterized protein n=1 Tax=Diabrotica virgifera virgifera TaxID=50390 RepID=A0ABM5K333_DIAVI|nr:uncharacterized protein LOC126883288 isoform X1 [Diabrotica virgifera virgifera]